MAQNMITIYCKKLQKWMKFPQKNFYDDMWKIEESKFFFQTIPGSQKCLPSTVKQSQICIKKTNDLV